MAITVTQHEALMACMIHAKEFYFDLIDVEVYRGPVLPLSIEQ